MSIRTLLTMTCDIQQRTIPAPGYSEAWTTTQTAVPCLRQDLTYQTQLQYASLGQKVNTEVYFDVNPGVTIANRLVFSDAVFEVRGGPQDQGGQGRLWLVLAESMGVGD